MTYKTIEQILMHVAAVAAILFAFWIAVTPTPAKSEPRCHQHHGVTHCH